MGKTAWIPAPGNDMQRDVATRLADEVLDFPPYVWELNRLLSTTPVDLKRVGEIIRTQRNLSDSIIRLCNLITPCLYDQIVSVDHGIVFLGIDQMRTLVLACCMVLDIGKDYAAEQLRSFWQHSVLTATLSERIARYVGYPRAENAYRAGLFHDAGALALVRWAARTQGVGKLNNAMCGEVVEAERAHLGADHCLVGNLIGHAWGLPAGIIDVLEFHHNPPMAKCDRDLVAIVAIADSFSVEHGVRFQLARERTIVPEENKFLRVVGRLLPGLGSDMGRKLKDLLEVTYLQKVNDFEWGNGGAFYGEATPFHF